jgi:hypothetical protein
MERHAEGTGLGAGASRLPVAVPQRAGSSPGRVAICLLLGAIWSAACVSLWPTSRATVAGAPPDVVACATAQAKQLGYHVGPDTTHGSLTAEKTLPFRDLGPDVTEYSRRDVLAVSLRPSTSGSLMTIEAETISVQESRRGMVDVPVTASAEVRADADTLLARCRHAAPNTSLP